MPPLLLKLVFGQLPKRAPCLVRPLVKSIAAKAQSGFIDPQLETHIDFWEAELTAHPWFAGGAFSAADIMMSFPIEAGATRIPGFDRRPKLKAFLETIHARPAWQRALERGGPYSYA